MTLMPVTSFAADAAYLTIDGSLLPGQGDSESAWDPSTGALVCKYAQASDAQLESAVGAARRTGPQWAALTPEQRGAHLLALAQAFDSNRDLLLSTVITEVGTPVAYAGGLQFDNPVAQLRWFANAPLEGSVDLGVSADGQRHSTVLKVPIGVVAAIPAYNYPIALTLWKIGAALAAGCTCVVLAPPRAALSVLALGQIATKSGALPPGVLNVVSGGPRAGQFLCAHEDVRHISFTGSDAVGAEIMKQAAPTFKRVTLELGGKSPAIVLPGADVEEAARLIHPRYARNAGQGCASPTRILVAHAQMDDFIDASRSVYDGFTVGDPWDPATVVGPVIRPEHKRRIEDMISAALNRGARVVLGGGEVGRDTGWWVSPHLISDIGNDDPISQDEVFGPVAVLIPYSGPEQAIEIANATRFGLAGYVYGDPELATSVARRLRAGTVTINNASGPRFDAPFGGFGHSGYGRECGPWGIEEFLALQHVQMSAATAAHAW
jgi:aldehyde dehydrogenase (NAD+)/betaine-aldehyde dehydrogenase